MKKLFLLVAVLGSLTFASCSKSATDYKKELKEMEAKLEQVEEQSGKESEEYKTLRKEYSELYDEMVDKYNADENFRKEYNDAK